MFPGGGLAEALAGRTVAYGGQLAAIGVEGLMQTFLPDDSPLANFSGTLPGKLLGAVAGARPAGKNTAGQQTPQLTKDQVDAKDAKMGGSGRGVVSSAARDPNGQSAVWSPRYRPGSRGRPYICARASKRQRDRASWHQLPRVDAGDSMTQYGYRVFAVELHDGGKREAQPFGEAKRAEIDENGKPTGVFKQYDYRDVVVAEVTAQKMRLHPFGVPGAEDDEDDTGPAQAKGNAIRFADAIQVGDTVRFKIEQGVMNADGTLIVDGQDVSMKDKPTLHPYRATLLAETKGVVALLAVEVRGNSCPSRSVIRGLKACSHVPWRLQVLGDLAGEAAMMAFLRGAAVRRVVFDRWTFDDDGQRKVNDVSMSVAAQGVDVRSEVVGWAEQFFAKFPGVHRAPKIEVPEVDEQGNRLSRRQRSDARKKAKAERNAEEAATRIERRDSAATRTQAAADALRQDIFVSRNETVDVQFNAVAVDLEDDNQRRKITPTTDFSKFTYVVGQGYVSDSTFFDQAEKTLRDLLPSIRPLPLSDSPPAVN